MLCSGARSCGFAGARQRGHRGCVAVHPAAHDQQKTWPHGVAVGDCLGDRQSAQVGAAEEAVPPAGALSSCPPGTSGVALPDASSSTVCRRGCAEPSIDARGLRAAWAHWMAT